MALQMLDEDIYGELPAFKNPVPEKTTFEKLNEIIRKGLTCSNPLTVQKATQRVNQIREEKLKILLKMFEINDKYFDAFSVLRRDYTSDVQPIEKVSAIPEYPYEEAIYSKPVKRSNSPINTKPQPPIPQPRRRLIQTKPSRTGPEIFPKPSRNAILMEETPNEQASYGLSVQHIKPLVVPNPTGMQRPVAAPRRIPPQNMIIKNLIDDILKYNQRLASRYYDSSPLSEYDKYIAYIAHGIKNFNPDITPNLQHLTGYDCDRFTDQLEKKNCQVYSQELVDLPLEEIKIIQLGIRNQQINPSQ